MAWFSFDLFTQVDSRVCVGPVTVGSHASLNESLMILISQVVVSESFHGLSAFGSFYLVGNACKEADNLTGHSVYSESFQKWVLQVEGSQSIHQPQPGRYFPGQNQSSTYCTIELLTNNVDYKLQALADRGTTLLHRRCVEVLLPTIT